ncbi:MAG TPA: DUF1080 domain-containing protein [Phycisphaerales bacterium]|nr:DUF1080 domain-containing protein [Phycisphaerales bacterium]
MRIAVWALWTVASVALGAGSLPSERTFTIDADRVVGRIDEKVYGHFLEHIYHSVHGGLWGELVWNRSFEQIAGSGAGRWRVREGMLTQTALGDNIRHVFGSPEWTDYEMTFEARKTNGAEGFLVLFRVVDDEQFYWANLGGWGNTRHAFEKGVKGRRWAEVGRGRNGRIEADRWHRIRVRCEGPRFQVWLGDDRVLDYTDTERPHLAGRVGLGTWQTTAQFRNIRVQSLDGRVLFEGLPEVTPIRRAAEFWEVFGEGSCDLIEQDPLNSNLCLEIASDGAEAGVQQSPFKVRRDVRYTGSMWARGEAQGPLVVRLYHDDTVLAEKTLGTVQGAWKEYAFELTPRLSCDDATLQVALTGQGRVCIDQVSLMGADAVATGGFRPDLLRAIRGLRPPIIRWPGGCFASSYQWKQGIGPQHKRLPHPRAIWDDLDMYTYGTDEFIAMCRRVGAEPLIVVNIGTTNWNTDAETHDYLQDALDWIEYCNGPADSTWGKVRAANGHPEPYGVRYWEIDNETWHMGAEAYVAAVNRFAPAMRKADPSITLAACGSGGFDLNWNRAIIQGCGRHIDYLSIHHYENADRFAEGPFRYEEFFRRTGELIAQSDNPEMRIYCSEWNAQSTDWRSGLYAGGLLNAFERSSDVFEIGGPALFLRHVSARAWDNAFINFDHTGWFPAPNYVVMQLWRRHYAPQRLALEPDGRPLNLIATRSDDGRRVVIKGVNPTETDAVLRIEIAGSAIPVEARMEQVAPGSLEARNTLSRPRHVRAEPGAVHLEGRGIRFTLPKLSAGVVIVRCDRP